MLTRHVTTVTSVNDPRRPRVYKVDYISHLDLVPDIVNDHNSFVKNTWQDQKYRSKLPLQSQHQGLKILKY